MNRRDFLKSLPFIGALVTTIFRPKSPRDEVITVDHIEDKRTETTWTVVNLGQPVSGKITWNDRMYAMGFDGDVWVSRYPWVTWTKVESGHIDFYRDWPGETK